VCHSSEVNVGRLSSVAFGGSVLGIIEIYPRLTANLNTGRMLVRSRLNVPFDGLFRLNVFFRQAQ
jgi:hypothetical protein